MDTEFITLNSRLTIKKDVLHEKKVNGKTDEGFTRTLAFGFLIVFFLYSLEQIIEEKKYLWIFQAILILIWMEPFIRRTVQTLFIKTWKSTVQLKEVKNVTTVPLKNGLETKVILHLQNGRQKHYIFRNAENQVDPFISAVAPPSSSLANVPG